MVNEKTPTLYLNKTSYEYDNEKEKFCSRSTLSWFLASLLFSLVVFVSLEFLHPTSVGKIRKDEEHVHIYQEEPIAVKVEFPHKTDEEFISIYQEPPVAKVDPPVMTDYISGDLHRTDRPDPWSLEFLTDPLDLCSTRCPPDSERYLHDPEIKLLILVPSATDHFQQRKAIRDTWGVIAKKPFGPIRLGFVLGTTTNKTASNLIREESSTYNDIIQADFEDTYRQLTTKSIVMLKWMAKRCPHAQYFLKVDDDTFVNVGVLANVLGTDPFISAEKFIGGYVHNGARPSRIPEEKYYVSEDDYLEDKYPPYASGSAYVMTGPIAIELFEASQDAQPVLPMEDVFVTGVCGNHIDATLIHEPRFKFDDPPNPPTWESFSTLATAHGITPDVMELVWNEINESVMDILQNQEAALNATIIIGQKKRIIV